MGNGQPSAIGAGCLLRTPPFGSWQRKVLVRYRPLGKEALSSRVNECYAGMRVRVCTRTAFRWLEVALSAEHGRCCAWCCAATAEASCHLGHRRWSDVGQSKMIDPFDKTVPTRKQSSTHLLRTTVQWQPDSALETVSSVLQEGAFRPRAAHW